MSDTTGPADEGARAHASPPPRPDAAPGGASTAPAAAYRRWLELLAAAVVLGALLLAVSFAVSPSGRTASGLATFAYRMRYRIAPVDPARDHAQLAELHLSAGRISTSQCVACHGDKLDSRLVIHRIHLANPQLPGLSCHDCHRRVDLTPRSNVAGGRWVDLRFCKKCHSKFPGLSPGSRMKPSYFTRNCTSCHKGSSAPRHAQPYLPRRIAADKCPGCHGGRVLPWTPKHDQADWLQVHGQEALRTGTKDCFQCHDFGLRFCDTCHAVKPPSHLPADAWLGSHIAAARADTRVCYACHELNFCRKCHVNHEAGWKQSHPDFVRRRGTASCTACHSTSFCGACHAGLSVSPEQLQTVP